MLPGFLHHYPRTHNGGIGDEASPICEGDLAFATVQTHVLQTSALNVSPYSAAELAKARHPSCPFVAPSSITKAISTYHNMRHWPNAGHRSRAPAPSQEWRYHRSDDMIPHGGLPDAPCRAPSPNPMGVSQHQSNKARRRWSTSPDKTAAGMPSSTAHASI